MFKAVKCFPNSYTCTQRLANLLIEGERYNEAYDVLSKFQSSEMSALEMIELEQLKKQVVVLCSDFTATPMSSVETSKSHFISIDPRLEMIRNEENKRFFFCTKSYIPAEEELINEQPVMFVLKEAGRVVNCSECTKKCTNTFVPCEHCNEVIFCSENCLSKALNGEHRTECGILGLMQKEISAKSTHTYRLLTQLGHDRLVEMSDSFEAFSCDNYFPKAQLNTKLDSDEVTNWFHHAQCDMHKQLHHRSPNRTAHELTGAIFLYALYRYKSNLKSMGSQEQVTRLIGILALDIAKTTLTQFNWHETVKKEQLPMGSFQCLIGAVIGHGCEPNATWSYYNGKLWIKSTKSIQAGEQIVISYGFFGSKSFYQRQEQMLSFLVACNCTKCALEVKQNFALRCHHCSSGPVPFETSNESFASSLLCMHCERPYMSVVKAQEVAQQFNATQQLIWLSNIILGDEAKGNTEEYMNEISKRMNYLAAYLYPHYTCWCSMIVDVCELFVSNQMYEQAVSWLQWMADRFQIYLCCDKEIDSFEKLYRLHLFTTAITVYIETSADVLLSDTKAKLTSTGEVFFKHIFEALEVISDRVDIEQLVEDKSVLLQSMYQEAVFKWSKFVKITQSQMVIPVEISQLLLKYEEDYEFLVTNDENEDPLLKEPLTEEECNTESKPQSSSIQSINLSGEDSVLEENSLDN